MGIISRRLCKYPIVRIRQHWNSLLLERETDDVDSLLLRGIRLHCKFIIFKRFHKVWIGA